MLIRVFQDKRSLGKAAADQALAAIRNAIAQRGSCRIVMATAASQREFLESLTADPNIDWSRVEAFHLDEYVGLPMSHPGSFRKMMIEQLINSRMVNCLQVGRVFAGAP
jgi:glucosamine-6-phosphate deaminase